MIQAFVLKRGKVSAYTANRELVSLRSLFNFGRKHKWANADPTEDMKPLPVEKRLKYIPLLEDIFAVIGMADPATQDYLWAIRETMARVGEVNRMTWEDVDLENRFVVLYTRKRRGGDLTPRKVPMTERLYRILSRIHQQRDPGQQGRTIHHPDQCSPYLGEHPDPGRHRLGRGISREYRDRKHGTSLLRSDAHSHRQHHELLV